MSLKKFIVLLISFITVCMIVMIYYPDYLFGAVGVMLVAGIGAELGRLFEHYRKNTEVLSKLSTSKEDESDEYHNDFSKVPAGIDEPDMPKPMPRGIIIGDPYRAFEENFKDDMARIGIVEEKGKDKN